MPRVYKTKPGSKKRTPISPNKLKNAVKAILDDGKSIRGTAKTFQIPVMTLKRYARKQKEQAQDISYVSNYKQSKIFTDEGEIQLVNYALKASKLNHGLTPKLMRRIAFEFAKANNKKMPSKWIEKEEATYDWLYGFMNRHKNLSLRIPEATSLGRATSFNKYNVAQFFSNLRDLKERLNFGPEQVWNIDETGITTVHKPKKIIASRGEKQVSKMTSGERGELVTVCAAINAIGNHLPPYMIFPRKNWQDRMIDDAPPGTDGAANSSGWMNASIFVNYLKHFVKYSKCSKENPNVIICDNHESHISIESLNYAKNNGIYLLTIPPHTSHKLQPLDRTIFGPLKSYFNTACDDWMGAHPGRPLTIYDVAGCLGKAYPNAMTPRSIQSGFRVTGIAPFDTNIFTEDEFLSSYVTDRDNNDNNEYPAVTSIDCADASIASQNISNPGVPSSLDCADASHPTLDNANSTVPSSAASKSSDVSTSITEADKNVSEISCSPKASTSGFDFPNKVFISPEMIRPHPKAGPRKIKGIGRKRGTTRILTDTPEKLAIENEIRARQEKKKEKERKANARLAKRKLKDLMKESSTSEDEILPPSSESDFTISSSEHDGSSSDSENEDISNTMLSNGDWVIVNFLSQKNILHRYVGQIIKVINTGYEIRFAKKINGKRFKWPLEDDIGEVEKYQVMKKLSPPTFKSSSKRVGAFEFHKSLRKFKIE